MNQSIFIAILIVVSTTNTKADEAAVSDAYAQAYQQYYQENTYPAEDIPAHLQQVDRNPYEHASSYAVEQMTDLLGPDAAVRWDDILIVCMFKKVLVETYNLVYQVFS